LIAGVVIALLWATSEAQHTSWLVTLAISALLASLLFLVVYGYLTGQLTYIQEVVIGTGKSRRVKEKKIIGGFRLTNKAQEQVSQGHVDLQDYFKGTAYKPDLVWVRSSRSLAKQLFVISYIGLVALGTISLASAALIMGFRQG
jgi:hypothetical protein